MPVTGEWMQGFVARGSFNLGFMHQFGLGVAQDLHLAKQHYLRSQEVDPGGLQTPVTMVLMALSWHMSLHRFPPWPVFADRLCADIRVHLLAIEFVAILTLIGVRLYFSTAATASQANRQQTRPT